jgi:hypothetical protein
VVNLNAYTNRVIYLETYTNQVVDLNAYTNRVIYLETYTNQVVNLNTYTNRVIDLESRTNAITQNTSNIALSSNHFASVAFAQTVYQVDAVATSNDAPNKTPTFVGQLCVTPGVGASNYLWMGTATTLSNWTAIVARP